MSVVLTNMEDASYELQKGCVLRRGPFDLRGSTGTKEGEEHKQGQLKYMKRVKEEQELSSTRQVPAFSVLRSGRYISRFPFIQFYNSVASRVG